MKNYLILICLFLISIESAVSQSGGLTNYKPSNESPIPAQIQSSPTPNSSNGLTLKKLPTGGYGFDDAGFESANDLREQAARNAEVLAALTRCPEKASALRRLAITTRQGGSGNFDIPNCPDDLNNPAYIAVNQRIATKTQQITSQNVASEIISKTYNDAFRSSNPLAASVISQGISANTPLSAYTSPQGQLYESALNETGKKIYNTGVVVDTYAAALGVDSQVRGELGAANILISSAVGLFGKSDDEKRAEERREVLRMERENERRRKFQEEQALLEEKRQQQALIEKSITTIKTSIQPLNTPNQSLDASIRTIYFFPYFIKNNELWLTEKPFLVNRYSDNTWKYMIDIKNDISDKLQTINGLSDENIEISGYYTSNELAQEAINQLIAQAVRLNIGVKGFLYESSTTTPAKDKVATDFWGESKKEKKATKKSEKTFWDN